MNYKIGKYEGNDVIVASDLTDKIDELLSLINTKEFDTIVIESRSNELERAIFNKIIPNVKHSFLIEDFFHIENMDMIYDEAKYYYMIHPDEYPGFSDYQYEISLAMDRMEEENGDNFSYRFIAEEAISAFKKEFALEETYPSLSYDKEANHKKVLFLDSNYLNKRTDKKDAELTAENLISFSAKRFLNIYLPEEITFLRLDL